MPPTRPPYEASDAQLDAIMSKEVTGQDISRWRGSAGLTYRELAHLLDWPVRRMWAIETGKGRPATKRFLSALRSIAQEMHRLKGLPIGKSLETVTEPKSITEDRIAKSSAYSGHWGYCANPDCGRKVYFHTNRQKYCSPKCMQHVYYLRKTGRGLGLIFKNKAHRVLCPNCQHVFRARGHGYTDVAAEAARQAHNDQIRSLAEAASHDEVLGLREPDLESRWSKILNLRTDTHSGNLRHEERETMGQAVPEETGQQ